MSSSGRLFTSADILDGTILNADVNAAAALLVSKLAAGGTANRIVATADGAAMAMQQIVGAMIASGTITTTEIADGTILNADVNASAGIVASKLAAGGTANRVVATVDGTTMAMQQVITAMLAANAVSQMQFATTGAADSTASTTFVDMISGIQVPITTAGGDLIYIAFGAFTHSAATTSSQVGVRIDAVASVSGPAIHSSPTVGAAVLWGQVHLFTGISAGAHTVKPQWLTAGGTVTAYGGRAALVVELKR